MRFVLILVGFISINLSAMAYSNGDLYQNCKKLAEKSFEVNQRSDTGCYAYFASLIDSTRFICELSIKSLGGKAERTDIRAVIQAYVNIASKNPQSWKYAPYQTGLEAIQMIAPCD